MGLNHVFAYRIKQEISLYSLDEKRFYRGLGHVKTQLMGH